MSDASKFKILDKIVNVKDTEGRAEAIARYNQLLTKMEKEFEEVDNKFTAVNNAVSKINSKISNFVNVVTDFGADNTAKTDCTEALKKLSMCKTLLFIFRQVIILSVIALKLNLIPMYMVIGH